MSILFSASELLNIAIEIERKDLAFYESLARSSGETRVCSSCNYLAGMEREHIRLFQGMLETIGEYSLPEDIYTEEYGLYLRSLIDSVAFTDDKVRNVIKKDIGDAEAIQIALGAEKDSILFYSEMRHLVPERERKLVDRIIDEERSHLRQLSGLKKELTKGG